MDALGTLSQIALQAQRFRPGAQNIHYGGHGPGALFGFLAAFHLILGIAFVAAIVYLAWKVGAYYDAARKKL